MLLPVPFQDEGMVMPKKLVVAIDGPAAAGKSTAGKRLAAALGYLYLDSGALYRTVALLAARRGIGLTDGPALRDMIAAHRLQPVRTAGGMRMLLDGEDVTEAIRGEQAGFAASTVSARPEVRAALLEIQRGLGREGGIVMDGRDIGTVIFPDAGAKFYLDAPAEVRGKRRYEEMRQAGRHDRSLEEIVEDIRRRDHQDSTRSHAPLARAPDACYIDNTHEGPDEVLAIMMRRVGEILAEAYPPPASD
jgi:CMP/dCMP kinase